MANATFSRAQLSRARNTVLACFLAWTLDAFHFFIMVFLFSDIAKEFGVSTTAVTLAVTFTLALRPIGAFLFGRLADQRGRRPALMLCIICFSAIGLLSGFAPTLVSFLIIRAMFGIAMGGEWGVGASLTMETIPAHWRGWVSGLLQVGYPAGYLLAALAFYIFEPIMGWRGLFMISAVPVMLVVFIYYFVPESPAWHAHQERARIPVAAVLHQHLGLAVYAVLLMTAFTFFSHASTDIYPNLFLSVQHGFDAGTTTAIVLIYNVGAIIGGIAFGALSQRIGRRYAIIAAASLALPALPLWAFANSPLLLGLGAFLVNIFVVGAWGAVPAHLNELSPPSIRATFPGFVYQLGNLFASSCATLQAVIGAHMGGNYSWALVGVTGLAALAIFVLVGFGPEARDVRMSEVSEAAS
jgi:SHS family lactate transporter-like MFS transporter